MKNVMTPHGFTLIELLVVLAILLILVSLLLPAVEKVKQSMGLAVCTDNLHKLYIAFMTFVEDHGGFPPASGFPGHSYSGYPRYISPYVENDKGIFQCPGDPVKRWPYSSWAARYSSYGLSLIHI